MSRNTNKDLLSHTKFITLKELAKQIPKGKRKDTFNSLADENFQDKYESEPSTWDKLENILGYFINESSSKPFIRRRKDYASLLKYFLERSQGSSSYSLPIARMSYNVSKGTTKFADVPLTTYKNWLNSKPINTVGNKIDYLMNSKVNKPFTNLFVVPDKAPVICINENVTNYYSADDLATPYLTYSTSDFDARISRKAEHALGGNSLWLEFDITDERGTKLTSTSDIATKKAALLTKLKAAISAEVVLQPTSIVSSFHSLHLYFVTNDFIAYDVQRFCLLALQFLFSKAINESTDTACINPERINRFPLGIQVCADGLQLVKPLEWLNQPYDASKLVRYLANQVNSHFDEFLQFANGAVDRNYLSLRYKDELLFTHLYNMSIYNEYNGLKNLITPQCKPAINNYRSLSLIGKVVINSIKKHFELHKKHIFYAYHTNNFYYHGKFLTNKKSFIQDYQNVYLKYPTFSIDLIKILFNLVKFEYQYYTLNYTNKIYRSIFEKYSITTIINHLKQTINLSINQVNESFNLLNEDDKTIYTTFVQNFALTKDFIDNNAHFTITNQNGIKIRYENNTKTLNLIQYISSTGKITYGRTVTTSVVPYERFIKDDFLNNSVDFINNWHSTSSFLNELIELNSVNQNNNSTNQSNLDELANISKSISISKLANMPKLINKSTSNYQHNINVLLNHPINMQYAANNPLLKAFYEKDVTTLRRLFNISTTDLTNNSKQVVSSNQLANTVLKTLGNKLILLLPYSLTNLSTKLINENDYIKVSSPFYSDKHPSASIYVAKINGMLCQRIKHFSSNTNKSYLDGNIIDVALFASNIFQQTLNKLANKTINNNLLDRVYKYAFKSTLHFLVADVLNYQLSSPRLSTFSTNNFTYSSNTVNKNDIIVTVDEIFSNKEKTNLRSFSDVQFSSISSSNSDSSLNENNPFMKLIKKYGDKTLSNILSPKNSDGFVFQENKSFKASIALENVYNILKRFVLVSSSNTNSVKSFSSNKPLDTTNQLLNATYKRKLIDLCNIYSTILDTFINDLIANEKNFDFRMFTLNYLLKLINTADYQITKRTLARRLNDLFLIGLLQRQQSNDITSSSLYNPRISNKHNTATHLRFVIPSELTLNNINQSINKLINYVIKENKSFTHFNENDLMQVFGIDVLYRFKDTYYVNKLLYNKSTNNLTNNNSSDTKTKTNVDYTIILNNFIEKDLMQINFYDLLNKIHQTKQMFNQKSLIISAINRFTNISNKSIIRVKQLILEDKFNYKQLNNLLFNFNDKLFCTSDTYRRLFLQQVINLLHLVYPLNLETNKLMFANSTKSSHTDKLIKEDKKDRYLRDSSLLLREEEKLNVHFYKYIR